MPIGGASLQRQLWIACFGAAGAIARVLLGSFTAGLVQTGLFPWGTWICNLIGCFLLGWLSALTWKHDVLHTALTTGFIASFTTFSAFSVDCIRLVQAEAWLLAAGYILSSIVLGWTMVKWGKGLGTKLNAGMLQGDRE